MPEPGVGPASPGRRHATTEHDPRWRPGERLQHLFEQRCDRLRPAGDQPAVDAGGGAADLRRARRAGQPARPAPARARAAAAATGSRCCSTTRCTPTSACWPCSRPTPRTCRWTPASPPTGSPTSCADAGASAGADAVAPARPPRRRCRPRRPLPRRGRAADRARRRPDRLTAAERGRAGRRAGLHHLHLRLHRPAQGRRHRARRASATSSGSRPRSTASRPDDRMYQGMTIAFDFSVEEIWVPLGGRRDAGAQARRAPPARRGPARVPRRAPGHRAVLRADAAGHDRRGPARAALPAGLRRGLPAGPGRPLAPAGPAVPQRLRAHRGHRHRDLDRGAPRPAGDHRRAAAHLLGRRSSTRTTRAAPCRPGEIGRDRHRRDRPGRAATSTATT